MDNGYVFLSTNYRLVMVISLQWLPLCNRIQHISAGIGIISQCKTVHFKGLFCVLYTVFAPHMYRYYLYGFQVFFAYMFLGEWVMKSLILCGFVIRTRIQDKVILSLFKFECTDYAPCKRHYTKHLFPLCILRTLHLATVSGGGLSLFLFWRDNLQAGTTADYLL